MSLANTLPPELRASIQGLIDDNQVVLFMKGDRQRPQCGFSARVVGILDGLVDDYKTVDVLSDPDIRNGIKAFSDWPTIPQLYVKGEFVGGSDIVAQAAASGELVEMLGIQLEEVEPPNIEITDTAADRLRQAVQSQNGEAFLRFTIGTGFRYQLGMGPRQYGDVEVTSNGVTMLLDRASAKVAEGTVIGFERQGLQSGFVITNPGEPQPVVQLAPADLKAWQDKGEDFVLVDVRTPPGARDRPHRGKLPAGRRRRRSPRRPRQEHPSGLPVPPRHAQPAGRRLLPGAGLQARLQPGRRHRRLEPAGRRQRASVLSSRGDPRGPLTHRPQGWPPMSLGGQTTGAVSRTGRS